MPLRFSRSFSMSLNLQNLPGRSPRPIEELLISPVNYVEAGIRADDPRAPAKAAMLDAVMEAMAILIAPISAEQARLARDAYKRFGKGRHPANLNLGDCFAYALSKSRNEALLFKGDDFPHTDIEPAR